jgi:shikimate kinase
MQKIIALSGPKHSGKTCAGKALAALLEGDFFDLDGEIKAGTGKSARELYREGKDVFKAAEYEALERICGKALGGVYTVVALGGGVIDNEAARALLAGRADCAVVLLAVSAETAWERIEAAQAESGELPAFLETENPKAAHREIHDRRLAAYRHIASLVIDAEHKTAAEIAGEILKEVTAGKIWKSVTP